MKKRFRTKDKHFLLMFVILLIGAITLSSLQPITTGMAGTFIGDPRDTDDYEPVLFERDATIETMNTIPNFLLPYHERIWRDFKNNGILRSAQLYRDHQREQTLQTQYDQPIAVIVCHLETTLNQHILRSPMWGNFRAYDSTILDLFDQDGNYLPHSIDPFGGVDCRGQQKTCTQQEMETQGSCSREIVAVVADPQAGQKFKCVNGEATAHVALLA